jgi:predicted Zn-dependent protease
LKNARFVYIASYDGDQFNPNLFPQDREAIASVEKSIREWGKLMVVTRPSEADIIILVQSRPSEDVLAVYDARMSGGQYLWRTMGRDGLQTGETPMATQFEKGFESVQSK